ncbi:MAG: Fur family transcriptional regulator, stress-responsive regulator [Actinomycetota bacterium]|nr:Fur family transcriptional regulator, stress-responsive regulator [Actinomycetota bacterium]
MTEAADLLKDAGLRVTAQRRAVLEAVAEADGDHPTVDDVARRVRAALGSVSTQAVYDVLDALQRAQLVRRLEPAGSPVRYEARVGDNHHHLVCRQCGLTVDVDCAVGRAPCLQPVDDAGFVIDEAEVTYWGTCPACQKKKRKASA